ncbi:MAG TPA: PQQ-binding-like beta-propeller repeat protein, partial [Candidatus Cybelea sp.]|nr:PQQ-binding-like beta-propeller repeat protein [Candidatus Cybelea sp.]
MAATTRITLAALVLACTGAIASSASPSLLPNGWIVRAPAGTIVSTGTMPQGAALSPNGSTLAVVESGFNPPALAFYATPSLRAIRHVALTGAFGRPVWTSRGVLVAGANADAIFAIDPASGRVRTIALQRNSYPVAVAASGGIVAVATNGDASVLIGRLDALRHARPIRVGRQLGPLTFSPDGTRIFVAVRSGRYVASVDARTGAVRRIATDLHPSDVLVEGGTLYVAQADADTVGAYDAATGRRIRNVFVGATPHTIGSSPNSLSAAGDAIYVSLGAANEVVVLRGGRIAARLPSGWYPTDALARGNRLYIVDGKGDGTKSNLGFDVMSRGYHDYIGAIEFGSIREIALGGALPPPNPQGAQGAAAPPAQTILHSGGPIEHVFFILKENRTYDQILGDMPQGNGDPKLVYFGARVTPNQHALAERFGLFDNFYTSGEVSDAGH